MIPNPSHTHAEKNEKYISPREIPFKKQPRVTTPIPPRDDSYDFPVHRGIISPATPLAWENLLDFDYDFSGGRRGGSRYEIL